MGGQRNEWRLDQHESSNALGHGVFSVRRGTMRDRAFQNQVHWASYLLILTATIIAWNTIYLMDAINVL